MVPALVTSPTTTLPAVGVPAETTTPMKPSTALRLGRLIRPRRTLGTGWDGEDGACAVGAISAGYGFDDAYGALSLLVPHSAMTIFHNDIDEWSDDQIVAWLESLGL